MQRGSEPTGPHAWCILRRWPCRTGDYLPRVSRSRTDRPRGNGKRDLRFKPSAQPRGTMFIAPGEEVRQKILPLSQNAGTNTFGVYEECDRPEPIRAIGSGVVFSQAADHLRAGEVKGIADAGRDHRVFGPHRIQEFLA